MTIKILLCFIFAIFLSTQVIAQRSDRWSAFENCPQYQQLTATKKATIDKIVRVSRKKMEPLWEKLHKKWRDLETEITKPKINSRKINKLITKLSGLHAQLFAMFIQARVKIIQTTGFRPIACFKSVQKAMHKKIRTIAKKPTQSPIPKCDEPGAATCPIPVQNH